jgi:hypothetical protein
MPAISGTFSGAITVQTAMAVGDHANHEMLLAQVRGPQKSIDPLWHDATISYFAVLDLVEGKGTQRGYFINAHVDGGNSWGTFEGAVVPVGGEVRCDGTWQHTGGNGNYAGVSGEGTFSMRMTSPKTVETAWKGAYELAGAAAAGRG